MSSFKLSVLSPKCRFYEGDCISLTVPTTDGKYGILAHHASAVLTIVPGEIVFILPDGQRKTVTVSDGILKTENNEVLILTDYVE